LRQQFFFINSNLKNHQQALRFKKKTTEKFKIAEKQNEHMEDKPL